MNANAWKYNTRAEWLCFNLLTCACMRVLYLCMLLHIWAQNHQRNVTYVTHRLKGTRSNVLLPFFFRTLRRAQNLSAARSSAESAVCTSTSSFLRANHDEKDLITHHGRLRSAGTGTTHPEVFFKSLMRNHLYEHSHFALQPLLVCCQIGHGERTRSRNPSS